MTTYTPEDREYMIRALVEHGAIRIYRKGATARLANDLAVEGLVTMRIVQTDEQSSYMLVEWIDRKEKA